MLLIAPPPPSVCAGVQLYLSCLRALQSAVEAAQRVDEEDIPDLLAGVKAYMLHDVDQSERFVSVCVCARAF